MSDQTSEPMFGISDAELNSKPQVSEGSSIDCPVCGGTHILESATKVAPEVPDMNDGLLMFYKCGDKIYLGAIKGRSVIE